MNVMNEFGGTGGSPVLYNNLYLKHRRAACATSFMPLFLIFPAFFLLSSVYANENLETLPPIVVTATRGEKPLTQTPAAVGIVDKRDIQWAQQTIGLDESLDKIPGVLVQNRYNFAQDLRVSIRGFGARAAFGIRGIKLLVDGIPESLPDGQAQVDNLDLGSTERIEVIRGPTSSLYGNASGGVINLITETGFGKPFFEPRLTFGSFGLEKYQFKLGGQIKRFDYLLNSSHLGWDGFRKQSHTESALQNFKVRYNFNPVETSRRNVSTLTLLWNYTDAPVAEDPGALTKEQLIQGRNQAQNINLGRNTGEALSQGKVGIIFQNKSKSEQTDELTLAFYGLSRDFRQAIVPRIIEFDRRGFGGNFKYLLSYPKSSRKNRLIFGIDLDHQFDKRSNFENVDGEQGKLLLKQNESVISLGPFIQNEWLLLKDLELTTGLRYDRVSFNVDDLFLTDKVDDSGERNMSALSPKLGLRYSPFSDLNLYGNFSTAFETPTTTELANRPTGAGGFNPDLRPQRAINVEFGVKGSALVETQHAASLQYDIAIYKMWVKDELVSFEVPQVPTRRFFRNAGETLHDGLELSLEFNPIRQLSASVAYTYSNFSFKEFQTADGNFKGNKIPGVPPNQIFSQVAYSHPSGLFAALETTWVGSFFVNDSNSESTEAYYISNFRAGYFGRLYDKLNRINISPFLGINNIFDKKYNGSVVVNATMKRFYEPAPGRNFHLGVAVTYK